jgi:hypothetical protein
LTKVGASTPENTDKTIELTLNKGNTPDYRRTFAILDGADANKFTLAGNKLTFIATAFEARSDVTMIVIITMVFKVSTFKGKCSATQAEFTLITHNSKTCPVFVSGKRNRPVCVFRNRNISRGNTKCLMSLIMLISKPP